MIALAVLGPTPGNSSSWRALAVLMLICDVPLTEVVGAPPTTLSLPGGRGTRVDLPVDDEPRGGMYYCSPSRTSRARLMISRFAVALAPPAARTPSTTRAGVVKVYTPGFLTAPTTCTVIVDDVSE